MKRNLGRSNADADGEVMRTPSLLTAWFFCLTPTAASGGEVQMTVEESKIKTPFIWLIVLLDLRGDKAVVVVVFVSDNKNSKSIR